MAIRMVKGGLSTSASLEKVNRTKARISRTCNTICYLCAAAGMPFKLWSYLLALLSLAVDGGVLSAKSKARSFEASNEDIAYKLLDLSDRNFDSNCRVVRRYANTFFAWQEKTQVTFVRRLIGGQNPQTGTNQKSRYELPALDLLVKLETKLGVAGQSKTPRGKRQGVGGDKMSAPASEANHPVREMLQQYSRALGNSRAVVRPLVRPAAAAVKTKTTATGRQRATVYRAADFQKNWKVKAGQLWEIPSLTVPGGSHWLLCGDSSNAHDVARVMGGQRADLLYTDPPYNVDVKGGGRDAKRREDRPGDKIANDNLRPRIFEGFLTEVLKLAAARLKPGGSYFVWHPSVKVELFARLVREQIAPHSQTLVWVKNNHALCRQGYHWKHEPCLYGWKPGAKRVWLGDRKLMTVWNEAVDGDRDLENRLPRGVHPTVKPVGLASRSIRNHVKRGGLVFDPFAGSGSTMEGAEHAGRLCATIELKTEFCSVVLERMRRRGLQPRLVNQSKPVAAALLAA